MADLELMLGVIMLSGFLFAAIARFNLHRYLQQKKVSTNIDKQLYLETLKCSSPETILDDGLHQLVKYFIAGMIIFAVGSATLVDNGALKDLVSLFFD
ncbi:hypothetical protein [Moritella sp. Urea-trap-13]|uniref:hypothetical protein n=1 Tax=Moritella sp. Urea-trap-13 TaxID=2058327 RepID=UPI000C32F5B1|nr:hypothetical protein [Moritella sp. Urea-trap-13]PKH06223.1 hypothetical protein CXF93_09855 [Moritella sp. Urea-trap-13]